MKKSYEYYTIKNEGSSGILYRMEMKEEHEKFNRVLFNYHPNLKKQLGKVNSAECLSEWSEIIFSAF